MNRSLTVFTALLCSVSFIPLAGAAPGAPLTDWHVAPVLSGGKNTKPYCALATSYPAAGVIITHARNKYGNGTVAFDFKNAAFEAKQYYGIDIGFDGTTQQFAAEAKNDHMLTIELRNDHPLYSALDSGKDIEITVQQGGPHVTIAGNSRAFFQLNYCVQALNDEPAPEIVAQRAAQPSFGLQQPAPTYADTAEQYPQPAAQRSFMPSRQFAQAANIQVDAPVQMANNAELSNMLDKARSASDTSTATAPKRQKLSSISSNDIVDGNDGAPVNTPSRQSLLFDNPDAANDYVVPRLSDLDKSKTTEPKAVPAQKAESAKAAAVAAKPAPAVKPAPAPVSKPVVAAPKTMPAAPLATAATDNKPSAAALPPPKDSLSDLDEPMITAKPPVQNRILSDKQRTVLATDYLQDKDTPAPSPTAAKTAAAAPAEKAKTSTEKAAAEPAPQPAVKPAEIVWDKPAVTSAAMAPPAASTVAVPAAPATTLPAPSAALADNKRQSLLMDNVPVPTSPSATAPTPASAEAKAILAGSAKPSTSAHLKADDVMSKAVQPVAPPAMAAVAPAPALPPAIIEQSVMDKPTRGPMKRANEVVSVDFPEEDDGSDDAQTQNPVMAAAKGPLTTPDALLQKNTPAAMTPISFKPPPAATATPWEAKNIAAKNGNSGYCILQSRFANQQSLFLSRSADGSATLGVDYGMDLLQTNRDYKTTVQVDNLFTEDFIGQARQPNLLVVQMGRKDSLFAAAAQGKALHVEMEGGASTFDISGAKGQMSSFNSCLGTQGGTPVVLETPTDMLRPAAVAPAPVAVTSVPVIAAAPAAVNTPTTLIPASPAPIAAAPAPAVAAPAKPANSGLILTTTQVDDALAKANIPASARPMANGYQWGSSLDVIKGQVTEQRFLADKTDLLEAVMRDIDGQEQACVTKKFSSEVGAPEQHGMAESVVAESSCTTGNNETTVTASLYQRIGQIFRIWSQKGPESAHDLLIRQRDRLASILDNSHNVATSNDQPRS